MAISNIRPAMKTLLLVPVLLRSMVKLHQAEGSRTVAMDVIWHREWW